MAKKKESTKDKLLLKLPKGTIKRMEAVTKELYHDESNTKYISDMVLDQLKNDENVVRSRKLNNDYYWSYMAKLKGNKIRGHKHV